MRAWYARLGVPWGAHLPAEATWTAGRLLFRKHLMGLFPSALTPAPTVPGLVLTTAAAEDLEEVVRVDAEAFDGDAEPVRRWLGPLLTSPFATVVLARVEGQPVGTAYTVRSDGAAGPAMYLAGVGVVPEARGRGVAGAMSSRVVSAAFHGGARLAHCHPNTALAARVHERLGFAEAAALDVYVDLA